MRGSIASFSYAIRGVLVAWQHGNNFKIQVVLGVGALALSVWLHISASHFAIILLAVAGVLTAETFNTALEELCDKFQPDHDPHIARIKDLAAGAVLISSLFAGAVGVVIFGSYL